MQLVRWIWRLIRSHVDNDLHNHAAEMAYFSMMAVFPFFFLLTAVVAFLPFPTLFDEIMELLRQVAPADVVQLLEGTIYEVTSVQKPKVLLVTLAVCLWLSSGAMSSVSRGLNKAFGLADRRRYAHFFGLSLLLTTLLGLLLILAIVLIMVGPTIQNRLFPDIGPLGATLMTAFRNVVAGFFLLLVHAGVYWLCPAVKKRFRLFTPGAIFAVFAWVAASWGLQFYLRHFNNYDKIYGSLGAVILTLLWFYLMSFVLLMGGQIDAMRHWSNPESQTTEPPPAPGS